MLQDFEPSGIVVPVSKIGRPTIPASSLRVLISASVSPQAWRGLNRIKRAHGSNLGRAIDLLTTEQAIESALAANRSVLRCGARLPKGKSK